MRIIAIIATYNERRFIEACLQHLEWHGIKAYLIDNCSTDNTVERAEPWLGRNLVDIEKLPREGVFDLRRQLRRKEELSQELEADWFIHLDADEIRLPPLGVEKLHDAFEAVDDAGCNAVDFAEFTFLPSREEPDHDHPDFQRTLRTYFRFETGPLHQVKAWKAQPKVELTSGGHRVNFPGVKVYPTQFRLKHYLILSVDHAIEKYVERRYSTEEIEAGWHGRRAKIREVDINLPNRSEMRLSRSDDDLDPTASCERHHVEKP